MAEQNRRAQLTDNALLRLSQRLIRQIKAQIAQIDLRIAQLINQSEELSSKAQKLTAVVGVGPRTPRCSWLKCPNWENSIAARLPLWRDSLPSIATAALHEANAPSLAAVAPCATASTWLL